jgi:hypothetical protein
MLYDWKGKMDAENEQFYICIFGKCFIPEVNTIGPRY